MCLAQHCSVETVRKTATDAIAAVATVAGTRTLLDSITGGGCHVRSGTGTRTDVARTAA